MKKHNYALLFTIFICSTIMADTNIEMFQEIRKGNKEAIKKRLENWQDCSQTDENGNNGLHIAAEEGQTEIVEMLTTESDLSGWWNYGCSFFQNTAKLPDKNGKNKDGKVPLHHAIKQGHVKTTEKLLEKKANPEITDHEGISPVFSVVKENKHEFIPSIAKTQLLHQKLNGNNLLHFAVIYNKREMIDELAQEKYHLANEQNNQGKTPTMVAAEQKDPTNLKILHAKGINLNVRGKYGRQPIHSAALTGNYEGAKYLLEHGVSVDSPDDNEDTGLLLATSTGEIKIVDLFLAYKADAKKRNKKGQDILCVAVNNNRRNLIERLKQHPDIKIDGRDDAGKTAFMNATIAGNHSMMRILYEAGANIHILDNKGENAIHKVAQTGDTNGLALLVPYHSSDHLDKKNHHGNSPIFVAIENGNSNIIAQLLHAGVSLIGTNNNSETIFHKIAQCKNTKVLPTLLSTIMNNPLSKPDIATQAHNGLSAMHYASANDNVTGMQELTKYGALYTDLTLHNDTLAHTATEYDALNSLQHLKSVMPMMLQQRNKNNHTPFIVAAAKGKLEALKLLFCENDIINRDINAAISIAHANKHAHIVSFLENAQTARMNICTDIASLPKKIKDAEAEIQQLYAALSQKDGTYLINYFLSETASLKQYSANELYYKTEAERDKIFWEYTTMLNKVLDKKLQLETKYNNILEQEKQEHIRQENLRIAREEQQRQIELQERLRLQHIGEARVKAEQKRIEEQKQQEARRLQETEFKRIEKENEEKKAKETLLAQQQALLDGFAAQKSKHAKDVSPANLQPSAPPMDPEIITSPSSCACGKKLAAKPLPCVKCKKKIEGVCPECIKNHKGRCAQCLQYHDLGIEKHKGECCIGTAACIEEKGVTSIPCDHCKNSSDKNCPACFELCHKKNIELNQPNRCPRCGKDTLNETLVKAVKAQK